MKNLILTKIESSLTCVYCCNLIKTHDLSSFYCHCGVYFLLHPSIPYINIINIQHLKHSFVSNITWNSFQIIYNNKTIYNSKLILFDFNQPLIPQLNTLLAFI